MVGFKNRLLFFVSFIYVFSNVCSEDVCVKKGPCSCEFSNGTGIDLTPSANVTIYSTQTYELKNNGTQYALNSYFYHPCYDVLIPNINATKSNGTCGIPLSICRHVDKLNLVNNTFMPDTGTYDFMGSTNVSQFSNDGKSLIYFNGPSSTIVSLMCTQTADKLYVYSLEEPDKIVLAFYSKNACLKTLEEPGRSLGSTLLIIFFSVTIFYLVLGICTKKFLMGATGVEVMPNLTFWTDLPNLVKDGWAFARNGFKLPVRGPGPATSPDPNSYDSI